MLMEQKIITKEEAGFVTKAIFQLKERILRWDSAWISQRYTYIFINIYIFICIYMYIYVYIYIHTFSTYNIHTYTYMISQRIDDWKLDLDLNLKNFRSKSVLSSSSFPVENNSRYGDRFVYLCVCLYAYK
jgi:hypothetical protein